MTSVLIHTCAGVFAARFSEEGLAELDFPDNAPSEKCQGPLRNYSAPLQKWALLTKAALESVLDGESPVALPPLDLRDGTDFQKSVWSALQKIPPGQTKSYSEIAIEIGSAKATRAVGRACGANPIPVLIPCHRVLAAGGKLGGFSGGLDWKRRLLSAERVLNQQSDGEAQRKFRL